MSYGALQPRGRFTLLVVVNELLERFFDDLIQRSRGSDEACGGRANWNQPGLSDGVYDQD